MTKDDVRSLVLRICQDAKIADRVAEAVGDPVLDRKDRGRLLGILLDTEWHRDVAVQQHDLRNAELMNERAITLRKVLGES